MAQHARKVLLVGWDSADWQVIDPLVRAGHMPQVARLRQEGAVGLLRSLPPYLSPIVWTSIATGKRPHRHGIHGFTEVNPVTRRVQPVSSGSRCCKALWNILSENGVPAHVIGWFVSHPAEPVNGVVISEALNQPPSGPGAEWPAPRGAVYPQERLAEFAQWRVRPEEIDPQVLDLLVPRWREVDQERDGHLRALVMRLAELYTVHGCAGAIAREAKHGFIGVYYHFLDWVSHDFMMFHPPRREGVDPAAFELYRDVVANAYRLQDLLLTDLLNQCGRDTTLVLVSDHGFYSDDQRPATTPNITAGIAAWHRPHGIVALGGPGVATGATVRRASVLDVAPTILALFGLPLAEDMDGRPLWTVLDLPPGPGLIRSWEDRSGPLQFPRPEPALASDDADLLLKQFADLGYIRLPKGEDPVALTESENAWNLGVALLDAGENEQALPHLETAWFHHPEWGHVAFQLALCQLRLGLEEESRRTEEVLRDAGPNHAMACFVLGQLEMARGNYSPALEWLDRAASLNPDLSGLDTQRGLACLNLEQWDRARACFDRAVQSQPQEARAWLGLARAHLRDQRFREALEHAGKALDLDDSLALAYLTVAQASEKLGLVAESVAAYESAFDHEPRLRQARRKLLALLPGSVEGLEKRLEVLKELHQGRIALPLTATPVATLRAQSAQRWAERRQKRDAIRANQKPVERLPWPVRPGSSGRTFVLVTGAPRSGTSLMMQMLQRGGLQPMADQQRPADTDNPEGYFEWERIKDLPGQPQLIEQTEGKAVKVISALLPCLPAEHRYKIVFMWRPPEEIARSQLKMLERQGKPSLPAKELAAGIQRHLDQTLAFLKRSPQFEVLTVEYPALVADAEPWVGRLREFLGPDRLPRAQAMAAAVQPALYRNRLSTQTGAAHAHE
jgi:tetratricopeptide (TPR) repeat protein